MKHESSVFKTILWVIIFLAILASSCTNVYFEKPVPQRGEHVQTAPDELTGIYVAEPQAGETVSPMEEVVRSCIRIESNEDGQMLVSAENRFLINDLPRFKKVLDKQKQEGKVLAYHLTESHLICTTKTENESGDASIEEQHIALIKSGSWYVLGQTAKLLWLFDFDAGRQLEYNPDRDAAKITHLFDDADRVQADSAQLVALRQSQTWFFNTRKGAEPNWSLVCVKRASNDSLVVKLSSLDNQNTFKERMDYYNAITPFRKESDNRFVINPTDVALNRLLQEENLFETIHLRRIEQ